MRAQDVTDTLDLALASSGCDQAHAQHRPRLLSDNGPNCIAQGLADYIAANSIDHVSGAPIPPRHRARIVLGLAPSIEHWHQTLKNRSLLENYFMPGDLESQIKAFLEHYNHRRYESLDNVTSADAYFGRADAIVRHRERVKRQTIHHRRLLHARLAA